MSDAERDPRDRYGALGTALAAAFLIILWIDLQGSSRREPRVVIGLGIVGMGASLVEAVRLFGSAVGRGHALPGTRFGGWVRALLAIAIGLFLDSDPEADLFAPTCLALLALEVVSRLRGPGLLTMGMALGFIRVAKETPLAISLGFFTSAALVAFAIVRSRLGASRLAAVGVEPWAPSDLACMPFYAGVAAAIMIEQGSRGHNSDSDWISAAAMVIFAIAEGSALVYLDRRLRAAEARRDAA